ncbi:MAG: formylmethanofuran dehydrogenase [Methanobrevibacter millerae]|uniref:Formylmethanofuran dehydrogenase n=1 Tax=Methanobrevibacter millerae TaxID=230361 RepID=A0A8T3VNR0_9EURY|nr:formylmethanofuran dehydrogenase [Methanobrevibacter millerae]
MSLVIMFTLFIGAVSAEEISSDDSLLTDSVNSDLSQINIAVNFEYADDNSKITPTFGVADNSVISQDYNTSSKYYDVKFNSAVASDKINVSVSAPGYLTQYQLVDVNAKSPISFNLLASESYKLGHDVTARADSLLDFKNADEVLAITTAGVPKLNGKTSEAAIDGILNYATEYISYGRGNILMLRQTAVDPIDFCFVVKKGNDLNAAIFLNGNKKEVYLGTISEYMTTSQWNALFKAVGGENAFSFASLANGWNDGVTFDVLQEAAFHGHICEGTLGGYTITKALLQYYPPIKETGNGKQSPGDITSYKVLGIPGDSANDAVIFFLDATSGKTSYVGFNTTSTGATEKMIGFIRWNGQTNRGTIVVMEYDSDTNKQLFEKETGITGDGSLEQLKYNTWWINRIYKNPASLVKILIEKEGLNKEQYLYLVGVEDDDEDEEGHVINATNSHGLDYAYIQGLDLPNATRDNVILNKGSLTYEDFKGIGQKAASMAKDIYAKELGVKIHKDMPNLMVLTSAGYVMIKEQSTEGCWDGLFEELGSRLSRKTLLPDHKAIWTPLWFNFLLQQDDGSLMSIYMRYNEDGTFFIGDYNGSQVYNINITTLNNSALSGGISASAYPDGNYFSIQSISNAWSAKPAFDQIMSFLFHNHACPGVQPGFFIVDYIQENFPLNENQSYIYIANEQYCKDDSLEYILDVSPGLGNYLVQKLTSDEYKGADDLDEEGILIIWDSANNIGQAVSISYKWPSPDLSAYATSESKRAAQIQAFIDLYNGNPNPILTENYHTVAHGDSRWITQEQYQTILAGGEGSSLKYLRGLEDISKEDLLKSMQNNNPQESNNTNTNMNTNTNTQPNSNVPSSSSVGSNNAQRSYSSVGTSSSTRPISDTSTSQDSPDDSSSESGESKSYEISKKPVTKSSNNNLIYSVVAVLIIGALFGVGYMRRKK